MAQPATPVYNAPMALSGSSHRTLGLEPERAMARNLQHLAATRSCILGPMPVQLFLDSFLPTPASADRSGLPASDGAFTTVPFHARHAAGIIKPLLLALNGKSSSKPRCPGLTFHNTATRSLHPRRLGYMKPDICCFTPPNAAIVRGSEKSSRVEFGYLELFFKIEADPSYDICSDPAPGADLETRTSHHLIPEYESDDEGNPSAVGERAEKVFAQHIAFAGEVFARQHRIFLFTVSMFGSLARLSRWDRSGCILTESFDVRDEPQHLCEFLWRFSQATHAGRGHDMTVEVALADEETLFRTLVSKEVQSQLDVKGDELEQALKYHYEPGRVIAIHILPNDTEEDERPRRFIVSRPVISSLSLVGRGTRGYWAVDTVNRSVVFLKDAWRSHSAIGKEGDVLRGLNTVGVRYVPTLVTHGDVLHNAAHEDPGPSRRGRQTTLTDAYISAPWRCLAYRGVPAQINRRKHYRLVVSPVGYDLRYFRSTEELLHATYDVFIAMKDALALGARLHRDISVGNILLVKEQDRDIRRGYLIDWECSCDVDESGQALQPGRVGTWEFMSIKMLRDWKGIRPHTIQDDMESLLYVVFYCALHWLPHNLTDDKGLSEVISAFFKRRTLKSGLPFGGDAKLSNTMDRLYTSMPAFGSQAFREWLNIVFDFHSPPRGKEVEYAEKWSNPDYLDAFWSEFLRTHDLEHGDRVTHEMLAEYVPGDSSSSSSSEDSDGMSSGTASSERVPDERDSPQHSREPSLHPKGKGPAQVGARVLPEAPVAAASDREVVHASPQKSFVSGPDERHTLPQPIRKPSPHPEYKDASLQLQPGTSSGRSVVAEGSADAAAPDRDRERAQASPRKRPRPSVEDAPPLRRSTRVRDRQEREANADTNTGNITAPVRQRTHAPRKIRPPIENVPPLRRSTRVRDRQGREADAQTNVPNVVNRARGRKERGTMETRPSRTSRTRNNSGRGGGPSATGTTTSGRGTGGTSRGRSGRSARTTVSRNK